MWLHWWETLDSHERTASVSCREARARRQFAQLSIKTEKGVTKPGTSKSSSLIINTLYCVSLICTWVLSLMWLRSKQVNSFSPLLRSWVMKLRPLTCCNILTQLSFPAAHKCHSVCTEFEREVKYIKTVSTFTLSVVSVSVADCYYACALSTEMREKWHVQSDCFGLRLFKNKFDALWMWSDELSAALCCSLFLVMV